MSMVLPSLCRACQHNRNDGTCDAYPAGIPTDIIIGGADHQQLRGDETDGLTFALAEGEDAAAALADWRHVFSPTT